MTTAERPANSEPQSDTVAWARRTALGMKRGSTAKSSLARTSTRAGPCGTPRRRQSLSADILLNDDTVRPRRHRGAILQLSPRGEIASPYRYHRPGRPPSVNGPASPFWNKPPANGRSLRFRPKTRVASGRTPAIWSPIQSGMKLGPDRQSLWRARKGRRGEPAVHLALPCPSLTVMDAAMGSPEQRCRPGSTDRREKPSREATAPIHSPEQPAPLPREPTSAHPFFPPSNWSSWIFIQNDDAAPSALGGDVQMHRNRTSVGGEGERGQEQASVVSVVVVVVVVIAAVRAIVIAGASAAIAIGPT